MSSSHDQIRDLIHRYATAIDTKDWALFRACFAPDSQAVYQGHVFGSREHLVRAMRKLHTPLDSSMHRVTNVMIDVLGPDDAVGSSYVDALLVKTDHPDGPLHRVAGRYTDEYRRTRGIWTIRRRRFDAYWIWERDQSRLPDEESRGTLVRVPALTDRDTAG